MPHQRAGRYWSSKSSVLFTSFVTHLISSPMLRVGGSMCRVFGSKIVGQQRETNAIVKVDNDRMMTVTGNERQYAGKSDADVIQSVLSAS